MRADSRRQARPRSTRDRRTAVGALGPRGSRPRRLPVRLGYGFAPIDDEKNVLDNPSFRGLGPAQIAWMFTTRHTGHYIPVTWLTLGLDYTLWGLRPRGYHLTSLACHLATAVAFFLLCVRLLGPGARPADAVAGALAAALFFAVHPLRVESVVWVSERRDVVCGLFSQLTLHAYVSAARAVGPRRRRLLALTGALFVLALLSKGIAVALIVAFLSLDATLLRRLVPDPTLWWRPEHRPVVLEGVAARLALLSASATLLAIVYVLAPISARASAPACHGRLGLTFYLQRPSCPTRCRSSSTTRRRRRGSPCPRSWSAVSCWRPAPLPCWPGGIARPGWPRPQPRTPRSSYR